MPRARMRINLGSRRSLKSTRPISFARLASTSASSRPANSFPRASAAKTRLAFGQFPAGEQLAADPLENRLGSLPLPVLGQPARAFRHEEHRNQEQQRGNGGHAKHPAPPLLAVPRLQDLGRRRAGWYWPCEEPVHHLRRQQTDHDSELIHGDQPPAHAFRRDLRDEHRRKARGQAYRHAARYSPGEEHRERARHSGSNRTDGEQERRKDKQTFPSELVAEHAGSQRAE